MLGSECDLKMHVQNLGHPLLYKSKAQKPHFSTTSQLNGNFTGLYIPNLVSWRCLKLINVFSFHGLILI